MSKKTSTTASLSSRGVNVTIGFCLGITLLFTGGCEKADQPRPASQSTSNHVLNVQEQALVGRWELHQKESYEIAGVDSMGNCNCNLLNASVCDSSCEITFFSSSMGAGSIGGCDEHAAFSWYVPQAGKLQTNNGPYQIEFVCKDSMVLSVVYTKDILQIKDVFHYKNK